MGVLHLHKDIYRIYRVGINGKSNGRFQMVSRWFPDGFPAICFSHQMVFQPQVECGEALPCSLGRSDGIRNLHKYWVSCHIWK